VGGTSLNDSTLLGHNDDDLEGSEDGDAVDNTPADGSQKNSSRIYKDGSNPSALSVQAVSHRVSKRPGLTGISIASLAAEFGAVDFLTHLNHFIQSSPLVTSPTPAAGDTLFSLYKRSTLTLPSIPEIAIAPARDTVHSVKQIPQAITTRGIKKAVPAQFSTILVQTEKAGAESNKKGPLGGVS